MDWMEGLHLNEFLSTNPSQKIRNKIGQTLWNFYDYQVHVLRHGSCRRPTLEIIFFQTMERLP